MQDSRQFEVDVHILGGALLQVTVPQGPQLQSMVRVLLISGYALELVDSFECLGRKYYRFGNSYHGNAHACSTNHDLSSTI